MIGDRTFGVLTKLDLMDKGTNALDVIFFSSSCLSCFLSLLCSYLKHVTYMFLLITHFYSLKVLEGRSSCLQHPWVGIVNRSQSDINKNVDMIVARRKERKYFATRLIGDKQDKFKLIAWITCYFFLRLVYD
jgi:hypothetical protein